MKFLGELALGATNALLGNILGRKSNKESISMQEAAARRLMNLQNEYNTPKNQIDRLKQAGLNPAMLFGDGSSMPAAASPSMPSVDPNSGAAYAQMFNNASLVAAQRENITADTKLKNTQADETQQRALAEKMRNEVLPKLLNFELEGAQLQNFLTSETIGLTKKQAKQVGAQTELLQQNVKNAEKQFELMAEELRKTKSEADLAEVMATLTPDYIRAQMYEINSKIRLNDSTCEQIRAMVGLIGEQETGQRIQNGISAIIREHTNYQQTQIDNSMGEESKRATAERKMSEYNEEIAKKQQGTKKALAKFAAFCECISGGFDNAMNIANTGISAMKATIAAIPK